LQSERRGGVLPLPNPAFDAGEGGSTCGHQPTNGAKWPEARTGLVCWGWRKRVLSAYGELCASVRLSSCAKETTRCRDRGPSDQKRSSPNSLQNRSACATSAKQKNTVRDIVPPHGVPTRTERKPTAEFVDHGVVRAGNPIGRQRNLARPFTVDPACAQFTFAPGRPFKRAKLSLGQQQRIQAQRAKAIPYSAHR
jgi:hypothetical protein